MARRKKPVDQDGLPESQKKSSLDLPIELPEAEDDLQAAPDETEVSDEQSKADAELSVSSENEMRTAERTTLRVTTIVQFRNTEEDTWKEITEVTTVSKNGAGLVLSREYPVGRIVSLVMQMPLSLRMYDHDAQVYPILGVIQNCTPATINEKTVYHVGVAFIGKQVPEAFRTNPKQCYRIAGQTPEGLWAVTEAATAFKTRKYSRFWRRFEVAVSVRDPIRKTIHRDRVYTRDVSVGGMSMWGPVQANIGDRIKITSKDHDFFSLATVRNRTEFENEENSLVHVEFEGGKFPVSKILVKPVGPETAEMGPSEPEPAHIESDQGELIDSEAEFDGEVIEDGDDQSDAEVVRF